MTVVIPLVFVLVSYLVSLLPAKLKMKPFVTRLLTFLFLGIALFDFGVQRILDRELAGFAFIEILILIELFLLSHLSLLEKKTIVKSDLRILTFFTFLAFCLQHMSPSNYSLFVIGGLLIDYLSRSQGNNSSLSRSELLFVTLSSTLLFLFHYNDSFEGSLALLLLLYFWGERQLFLPGIAVKEDPFAYPLVSRTILIAFISGGVSQIIPVEILFYSMVVWISISLIFQVFTTETKAKWAVFKRTLEVPYLFLLLSFGWDQKSPEAIVVLLVISLAGISLYYLQRLVRMKPAYINLLQGLVSLFLTGLFPGSPQNYLTDLITNQGSTPLVVASLYVIIAVTSLSFYLSSSVFRYNSPNHR